jgi:hypothetical protein
LAEVALPLIIGGVASSVAGELFKPHVPAAPDAGPPPDPIPTMDEAAKELADLAAKRRQRRTLESLRIEPARPVTGLQIPEGP